VRVTDGCYPCSMNARNESLPPRESLVVGDSWRVAHAFDSALPGWLVVMPLRHVGALEELSEAEAAPLGSLLWRASSALRSVTGATKSYLMFFAEADGFSHLHIHVVPRMSSFTPDQIGPRVFDFLGRARPEWVSAEDQDALALELRAAMTT